MLHLAVFGISCFPGDRESQGCYVKMKAASDAK